MEEGTDTFQSLGFLIFLEIPLVLSIQQIQLHRTASVMEKLWGSPILCVLSEFRASTLLALEGDPELSLLGRCR